MSANVRALQHLPALHHVLLWEEAGVSIASGPVTKPSQFPLSAQEILDESERFLRDFAHAARDLGPPSTIYQPVPEPRPIVTGCSRARWCRCSGCSTANMGSPTSSRRARSGSSTRSG